MSTIFYGAVVSPTSLTTYLAAPHALLSVSRVTGDIEWLEEDVSASALQDILAKHGQTGAVDLVELKTGEFLMPGFVDTHAVSLLPSVSGRLHAERSDGGIACSSGAECWQVGTLYRLGTGLDTDVCIEIADNSMSCSTG